MFKIVNQYTVQNLKKNGGSTQAKSLPGSQQHLAVRSCSLYDQVLLSNKHTFEVTRSPRPMLWCERKSVSICPPCKLSLWHPVDVVVP